MHPVNVGFLRVLARPLPSIVALVAIFVAQPSTRRAASPPDPFAWLQPTITVTADDRRILDRRDPIARILPSTDRELAVFAAIAVNVDAARLQAWIDRIEALKKSQYVLAIARFSDPPRLEDLADLTLDHDDLESIRACHPGNCDLKLSAAEMTTLQEAAKSAGATWRPALQTAFRDVVLNRVRVYLAHGEIASYQDKSKPISLPDRFNSILEHLPFLSAHEPAVAAALVDPPTDDADIDSFFYWSKELLARKAVVSVTEVRLFHGRGEAPQLLVTGKDIFATHYINGSLGLTALVAGDPGGPNYLVYVNRTSVDMPGGLFSGMLRWFAERRLRGESAGVLRALRDRLESGDPPPLAGDQH